MLWAHRLCYNSFPFLYFLRKISPEITSTNNTPLFAEEDCAWANIRAHLPLLYTWDTYHSMAWQVVHRSAPRIQTGEPQAAKAEHVNLTAAPLGWPHELIFNGFISWRNPLWSDFSVCYSRDTLWLLLPTFSALPAWGFRKIQIEELKLKPKLYI